MQCGKEPKRFFYGLREPRMRTAVYVEAPFSPPATVAIVHPVLSALQSLISFVSAEKNHGTMGIVREYRFMPGEKAEVPPEAYN